MVAVDVVGETQLGMSATWASIGMPVTHKVLLRYAEAGQFLVDVEAQWKLEIDVPIFVVKNLELLSIKSQVWVEIGINDAVIVFLLGGLRGAAGDRKNGVSVPALAWYKSGN